MNASFWTRTLIAAATLGASVHIANAQSADLTDVTVALGWLRNGQYSALLAADAEGYFEDEGLRLTLIDGGPGKNPVATVGAGQADFGITGATFIFSARLAPEPVDVVAIGAIMQKTPYSYITLADPDGPEPTPQDMVGKRIGIQSDGEIFLKGLSERNGLDMSTMEIVTVQGGAEPLLIGQVDFISGHIHNQTFQVEMEAAKPDAPENIKGKTWKVVTLAEHGVPSYNDLIFTTSQTRNERPEVVSSFLTAMARGLQLMEAEPEKVAQMVIDYPGQVETADKVEWRMAIQNDLNTSEDTREHGFLWMRPEVWDEQIAFYHENGQIPRTIAAEEVMTNEFNPGLKSQ